MKVYENIIIGGGASGLMFAAQLSKKKRSIIIEGNSKLGAKIEISGGGACNFTNKKITPNDYLADTNFIKETLKEYNNCWLLAWLVERGLEYRIKNEREYFCKKSSKEILNILKDESRGVEVKLSTRVESVTKRDGKFIVKTTRGDIVGKKLIVASGGLSFSKLGATDIGYEIAKSFGHTITSLQPALVGFTLQPQEAFFKELSGVSVTVSLRVAEQKFDGSLLFAHKGLSGPVILNASLFWQKGQIEIDFLPKFDYSKIKSSTKSVSNLLPLPKRVVKAFFERLEIEDKSAKRFTQKDWDKINSLKSYSFAPAGTFGFGKAEVTKGGVVVDEVDKSTFMSKRVENLFFLAEVLDVTGKLGGYNFQWAFASATKCARAINSSIES